MGYREYYNSVMSGMNEAVKTYGFLDYDAYDHVPEGVKEIKKYGRNAIGDLKKYLLDAVKNDPYGKTLKSPRVTMTLTNELFKKNYMSSDYGVDEISDAFIKKFFSHEGNNIKHIDDYPILTIAVKPKNFEDRYKAEKSLLCYDGYKFFKITKV